jgi:hypothetical protein
MPSAFLNIAPGEIGLTRDREDRMPIFYMHLQESDGLIRDMEGGKFANLPDAEEEARRSIREMVSEYVFAGKTLPLRGIELCDETGNTVSTVTVASAIAGTLPALEDTSSRT